MRLLFLSLILLSAQAFAFDKYLMSPEEALKIDPEVAANAAVARGDLTLIMVADCFMGIEGFMGSSPPNPRPEVLGEPCDELLSNDTTSMMQKIKAWARKYNETIQQHNKSLEPTP